MLERSQTMKRLNAKIARQRMLVMKCLEASPPSKDELNRQICALQDLQRQQIELEVSLLEQGRNASEGSVANDNCDRLSRSAEPDPSSLLHRRAPGGLGQNDSFCNSTMSLTNSAGRPYLRSRQSDDDERRLLTQSRGYSSVYLTVSTINCTLQLIIVDDHDDDDDNDDIVGI